MDLKRNRGTRRSIRRRRLKLRMMPLRLRNLPPRRLQRINATAKIIVRQ